MIEPLFQGAGGIRVYPKGYTRAVWEMTKRHGILFIVDEVATAFGRTGKMFACEHEGIEPDIMGLGKGISGGYLPLAATLTTEEIYKLSSVRGAPSIMDTPIPAIPWPVPLHLPTSISLSKSRLWRSFNRASNNCVWA